MKALTLYQPWTYLVSIGVKRWETRSWPTKHRGLLAIHAGKNYRAADVVIKDIHKSPPEYVPPFDRYLRRDYNWLYGELANGGLAALVEVVDCQPADEAGKWIAAQPKSKYPMPHGWCSEHELAFGDYSYGRWAWELRLVCALDWGMPIRGYQRLWTLPENLAGDVRRSVIEAGIALPKQSELL